MALQDPAPGAPGPLTRSPAVRTGLSIAVATGLYGISFGALSVTAGLTLLQTCVLSLLMFSGGSQFAFIGVLAGGGAGSSAAGAAVLLGVRNALYGVQLAPVLRTSGWRRLAAAQVTIDESMATSSAQADAAEQRRGFWAAGLGVFVFWNVFTLVGAIAGGAIGDPKVFGLDGAAVAAFLALLWPRLRSGESAAIAVAAAVVTVVAVPATPPGIPILLAAVVAAALAWFRRSGRPASGRPDGDPS